MTAEARVRAYRPSDRDVLRDICYDSGLMGESIDPLIGCRDLYADYWMTYYLEHEPESTFVAVEDDAPVGYLVGCRDTRRFEHIQDAVIWPHIVRRLMTGRYGVPLRLGKFLLRILLSQLRDRPLRAPVEIYPAHLHMNVAAPYRERGHGGRLLAAYLDYLLREDVRGVHLLTTNRNTIAVPLYEKWGFRLEDRAPVSVYRGYVEGPVEALLFVRTVATGAPAEVAR